MHFITYTTGGFTHFTENLLKNFEEVLACHSHHIIVVCVDEQARNNLANYASKPWLTLEYKKTENSGFASFANFGTSEYNKILHYKIVLIRKYLPQYEELYFVDSDIVFFRDPLPTINATPGDILFQQDAAWNQHHFLYHTYVCAGNIVVRNNTRTLDFLDKWIKMCNKHPELNDQEVLYNYFAHINVSDIREVKELHVNVLPMEEFQNGLDAFQCGWNTKAEKVCIHANYRVGSEAKINALKSINMWFMNPE